MSSCWWQRHAEAEREQAHTHTHTHLGCLLSWDINTCGRQERIGRKDRKGRIGVAEEWADAIPNQYKTFKNMIRRQLLQEAAEYRKWVHNYPECFVLGMGTHWRSLGGNGRPSQWWGFHALWWVQGPSQWRSLKQPPHGAPCTPCQRGEPGQYAHLTTQREGGVDEERRRSNGFWCFEWQRGQFMLFLKSKTIRIMEKGLVLIISQCHFHQTRCHWWIFSFLHV